MSPVLHLKPVDVSLAHKIQVATLALWPLMCSTDMHFAPTPHCVLC